MITLSPALPLTVALCTVSLFTGGLRLYINPTWVTVRREGSLQDLKQAESVGPEWYSRIGLHNPRRWVKLRMAVTPEGSKEPPVASESTASEPPHLLGQLWDSLAQADRTQLCCRALQSLWLCFLFWVALRLWRNGNRPHGQGDITISHTGKERLVGSRQAHHCKAWRRRLARKKQNPARARKPRHALRAPLLLYQGRGWLASSSMGRDCLREGTFSSHEVLCQLEAKIALLAKCTRLVYHLHLKKLRQQHSEKKAQEKGKRRRASPSSSCTST